MAGASARIGRRIEVRGVVQGVGFRPFVHRLAHELGIGGVVQNGARGVTIEAHGTVDALERFVLRLETERPRAARIGSLSQVAIPAEAVSELVIAESDPEGERRASIPADLPTCAECLAEIRDPSDRRFGYAFTSCTHCGPRFTIARDVPYDRPATTMEPFEMCPACRREYEDPNDRRFHAQPNACPVCGPRLELRDAAGGALASVDPIADVASALRSGAIVAVKGLGGFHLACDATAGDAVAELRRRKHRDEKPFAVMVADLAAAEALAVLDVAERELLESIEHPIVLLTPRPAPALAPQVAPSAPRVGLMLPYTPLHHLLLAAAGRPLVMTSGNLSDEPIADSNEDALKRLRGIADLYLLHDRAIANRCDDSVALVIRGRPVVTRRARGFVPRGVELSRPVPEPVLACGAHLKNTFCIAAGDTAYLGPHIGDLENLETYESLAGAIARMERFLGVRPRVVAHDLHPKYLSTRYARERLDARLVVPVQHHHAHAVAAMVENNLEGPVLALAYDGVGLGTDGEAWGSEIMRVTRGGFERLATFRPIHLPGGDRAVHEPWRIALSMLDDAFDGAAPIDALELFRDIPPSSISTVRRMLDTSFLTPAAHGLGRWFDAIAALVLARPVARHEGQLAIALEHAAGTGAPRPYPYTVDARGPHAVIDLRPLVRAATSDVLSSVNAATISARFHDTIVAASTAFLTALAPAPVVLTGGCFQNARLTAAILDALPPSFEVHTHREVPPGDGGLALGQAIIAAAQLEKGDA